MRFAGIIILAFVCTVHTQTASGLEFEGPAAKQETIDHFMRDALLFVQGESLETFRNLGEIQSEIIKTSPNSYDPGKLNEFRTLTFDGLEIYGLVNSEKKFWPIILTVTSPRWKILNDLNVGAPVGRIHDVLGEPTKQSENFKQYCSETECVNFQIKDEVILKIEFNYYAD